MNNAVEMVSSPRRHKHTAVPTEDFDDLEMSPLPSDFVQVHPVERDGKRIFTLTASVIVSVFVAMVIFHSRGEQVDPTMDGNTAAEHSDPVRQSDAVAPSMPLTAAPALAPVTSPVAATDSPSSMPISAGEPPVDPNLSIEEWLNKTITLDDGVQYKVLQEMWHDPKAFTEGLAYANGVLYESTGMNGASSIRVNDPQTGKTIESHDLDSKYFGEGLTFVDGKLFQLTYKRKTGFIFDASDFSVEPQSFHYETNTGEGWGLTYNPAKHELIVSDGSKYLHFWDANTTKPLRKLEVKRQNNVRTYNINELEWWRGRVLANVWFKDIILVINPETGIVEKEYDFTQLWGKAVRKIQGAGVLNGISVSEDPDALYITGKNWKKMFLVKLF